MRNSIYGLCKMNYFQMFVTTMTLVLLKYVKFDHLFLDLNILGCER